MYCDVGCALSGPTPARLVRQQWADIAPHSRSSLFLIFHFHKKRFSLTYVARTSMDTHSVFRSPSNAEESK